MGRTSSQAEPDILFLNGNIHTMGRGRVEAMAIRDGRIILLGSSTEISRLGGSGTERVDLKGGAVTPGLIDSHGHVTSLGRLLTGRLDLGETRSFGELLSKVSVRVNEAQEGEWVIGARWDQTKWGQAEFPTHDGLTAVSPEHPVLLYRVDGHAFLANLKAMKLAGIDRSTKDPAGGRILRDSEGNPSGVFVDHAMALFRPVMPVRRGIEEGILAAQERCLSVGLTGVHDAGIDPDEIEMYRNLDAGGRLHLGIYGMLMMNVKREPYFRGQKPLKGRRFTLRAIKILLDGAMGSRGAWMLEEYADSPGNRGFPLTDAETLERWTRLAIGQGWQVCTHAIGDRAIREAMNAYEAAGGHPWHRLRIEHAQVAAREDLPRFAALGIIPSIQPVQATSDMPWVEDRLGKDRLRGAYAWATLLRSGAPIAAGSDFPVESPDPMKGIHAAITRQDAHGRPGGGWCPEERLSREAAFHAFTLGAAFAAFEEKDKGSLEPGKLADFVVWSKDPISCPAEDLPGVMALRTVISGRTVFERP